MKVFLISPLLEETSYKIIQEKLAYFNPGQKFYQLLKKGLEENGVETILYTYTSLEFKPFLEKKEHKGIKYFYYSKKSKRYEVCKKLAYKLADVINPKDDVILADAEAYWTLRAALLCRKKCGCKVLEMITDFPHHVYSYSTSLHKDGYLKRLIKYANAYMKLFYIKRADAYILLTEMMTRVVGKRKPYVVIEGFSQIHKTLLNSQNKVDPKHKKRIVYLGSLNDQSGIMTLVKACTYIKRNDFELWIYGNGYAKEQLISIEKIDSRIHYGGVVSLEMVSEIEQAADLLINPRPSKGEYNKYSFPSKTLEYMSSGTAMCCTRLSCIPKEYDKYLYWISDDSIQNMADSINKILDLSSFDLIQKGEAAKNFVLFKKSPERQLNKVITMMNKILRGQ